MILMNRKHGDLLEVLRKKGRQTVEEASAHMGLGVHAVLLALKDLENMGLAQRTKRREGSTNLPTIWSANEETVMSRYLDSLHKFEAVRRG